MRIFTNNKPTTFIFEKGITLHRQGKHWKCLTTRTDLPIGLRELSSRFQVRPILKTLPSLTTKSKMTILLSTSHSRPLTQRVAVISMGYQSVQFYPYDDMRTGYTLRDVTYHCQCLAENCSTLCVKYMSYDAEISDGLMVAIQGWVEPCYFEAEACLSSIVRSYELLQYRISRRMLGKGNIPRSYEKMLEMIDSKVPTSKQESEIKKLVLSTKSNFIKLKEYRDCLQHNTFLSALFSHGYLNDLGAGIWGAHLPLPDNPECKSFQLFTFGQHLDALTYCWEATNALVSFVEKLTRLLQQKKSENIAN